MNVFLTKEQWEEEVARMWHESLKKASAAEDSTANEIARLRVALEQCRVNRWSPMLVKMICDRELRK